MAKPKAEHDESPSPPPAPIVVYVDERPPLLFDARGVPLIRKIGF